MTNTLFTPVIRYFHGLISKRFIKFTYAGVYTYHDKILKIYGGYPQKHIATIIIGIDGTILCESLRESATLTFNPESIEVDLADPTSIDQITEWCKSKGLIDDKQEQTGIEHDHHPVKWQNSFPT